MPLSKARNRARMRLLSLEAKGLLPDCNLALMLLPPDERKRVLADIARGPTEMPVTAGQRIAAIKELNLMEHIYDTQISYNEIKILIVRAGHEDVLPLLGEGTE